MAPCRGTRKKPSANSGANSAGGRASGTEPGSSSRREHLRGTGQEERGRCVADLVELGDEVDDPVELTDHPVQVGLAHGQLRQLGHVEHVVAADAHALSHSRSSPA